MFGMLALITKLLTLLTLPLSMVCTLLALGSLATRVLCPDERLCAGVVLLNAWIMRCLN